MHGDIVYKLSKLKYFDKMQFLKKSLHATFVLLFLSIGTYITMQFFSISSINL